MGSPTDDSCPQDETNASRDTSKERPDQPAARGVRSLFTQGRSLLGQATDRAKALAQDAVEEVISDPELAVKLARGAGDLTKKVVGIARDAGSSAADSAGSLSDGLGEAKAAIVEKSAELAAGLGDAAGSIASTAGDAAEGLVNAGSAVIETSSAIVSGVAEGASAIAEGAEAVVEVAVAVAGAAAEGL